MYHTPVLLNESLNLLEVKPGQNYIDATLGNGGHTIEILRRGGIVFGIDQDPDNLDLASKRISSEGLSHLFHPIHGNFSNLKEIYEKKISVPVSGIIYDLGLSSNQQKSQGRGFSFSDEESLDMRLDQKNNQISAEEIINTYPFEKLFDIFTKYAQEKYARPLIYQIINRRQKQPFKKADDLADVIRNYYQTRHHSTTMDPATKIFMALRIVVNHEFDNLKTSLEESLSVVEKGGVVSIITFHSGEDRIVKLFILANQNSRLKSLTNKGIRPSANEVSANPLSRSATLRSYRIV